MAKVRGKFFEDFLESPELAGQIAFNAADLGAEAEMDAQGRITFPPELRRELGIEEQTIRLFAYRGRIEVLSEQIYEERKQAAIKTETKDVQYLYSKGLK